MSGVMSSFSIIFSISATSIHCGRHSSPAENRWTTSGHSLLLSPSVFIRFYWIFLVYFKVSDFFRVGHGQYCSSTF
ncbi:uncharacterized protein EDB93DRAFT_1167584 [Suillus bovinus]|uniref:uncharacterized protein n=1 Tax=Suillus bovinus TaxID=48563 RepID=UPI001B866476|nr:uncharacterized protein EDB93DRAFT_1167584 [Suillus bovinus]KAG2137111.1 hypothetical protein EDB93DRAFT_1167584 [Suillus bovinus]